MYVCSCLPTLRDSLSVSSSRVKQSKKKPGQQMDLLLVHGWWCEWLEGSQGGKGTNKVARARSFYQVMGGRINGKSRRKDTPE